jgi:hypothetical protein
MRPREILWPQNHDDADDAGTTLAQDRLGFGRGSAYD